MANLVTNLDCIKILKNYLHVDNIDFKSFELKPISENVEGFMGEHYNLLIKYEKNGQELMEKFFIKTKPVKNKAQEEMADKMNIYRKEIFLYDFLFKEFKRYGFNVSFAAESYYYIKDAAIVMQNLVDKGFIITERSVNLSIDHLRVALRALALFHAAGYAYERTKAKELGRNFKLDTEYKENMAELFYIQFIDDKLIAMKWWTSFHNLFTKIISLLPTDSFDTKHFQETLDNFETGKVFVQQTNIAKTCGHGDLWSNNILFKHNGSKAVDCRLVDYQISRYFYPCFDVILFIYCNTDVSYRNKHLMELYKYYHDTLGGILRDYGYSVEEIHPWDDFLKSVKMVLADALFQVVFTKCVVHLPKEKVSNIVNDNDDGFSEVMFDNSALVAEAFKVDKEYRKMVIETMQEFYNALLGKH